MRSWGVAAAAIGLFAASPPRAGGEAVLLPDDIVIRVPPSASGTLQYAAERTAEELRRLHGRHARIETGPAPADRPAAKMGTIEFKSVPVSSTTVPALAAMPPHRSEAAPSGYAIDVEANPLRVRIAGADAVGAWYGACAWLDSLRSGPDGAVSCPAGRHAGAPRLGIRFTRELRSSTTFEDPEQANHDFDWWARWRMNTLRVGAQPEARMRQILAAARLRGLSVLLAIGVRDLCAADEAAVQERADQLRQFLRLGGQGAAILWDDLAHARCHGHCELCRQRFGIDSLPAEIVHILEVFCRAAEDHPHALIAWCPSHYSANRYPEMSDEAFFRVIAKSSIVRERTRMFYCEFAPAAVAAMERLELPPRIWWYNGVRDVFMNCSRWPLSPATALSIPGFKAFPEPDFAPFDRGWKTGVGVDAEGRMLLPSARTWSELRAVGRHYIGFYPCTPTHPYHAAVTGLFAVNPERFSQAEADRVIFRAMFGPGAERAARIWSETYNELQILAARRSSSTQERARQGMERWRQARQEVASAAAAGRSMLSPSVLQQVLARMQALENAVVELPNKQGQ